MREDKQNENQTNLDIPKRDKTKVAEAKPSSLTFDEAFSIIFKRYEQTFKELSNNE